MKASELRIGNLLYYDNELKEICSIHSDNTIRFKDKEKGSIGCFSVKTPLIKPIPLTEEWLLKFGFGKLSQVPQYHIEDFHVYTTKKYSKIYGLHFDVKIKYVHQIQNLYFALTGEELKLIH